MKTKIFIALLTFVLLTIVIAAGCSAPYATSDQVMSLQNQVNSLSGQLNSTQQQLASAQQALSQAQVQLQQQQNTYSTQAQPTTTYQPVYQPVIIYRSYPYGMPWNHNPQPPRPPQPPQPPHPPFPHH